jgi:guanyl-specific ribonuclease Sa
MRIADILRTLADELDQDNSSPDNSQIQNPAELIDVEPASTNMSGPDVNNKSVVPSNELPDEAQDIVNLIKQLSGMPANCNAQ